MACVHWFLGATSGGNQFGSNPLCFSHPRRFNRRHDFVIFWRRNPRGNESAPLFLFGKHRPANWIRFAHLVFFDFGGGVCSKARNASSNFTPCKLSGVSLIAFVFRFDFLGTDSLSAPRDSWRLLFH
jgi:hypothetical protein